ncbi:MAG TPA: hypothetical protein VEK11_24045 [Thermoanaerobaculia bacterium]|jgi:hypothetical protein|nr:hypothetical protein [Thermoanaerobaculia bacterium]
MRFTIEERHLTDGDGRPVSTPNAVEFHVFDAETIDDAVRLYVKKDQAELIGNVLKFPGFQAVATVRKASGVYTLQFTPASQQFKI